MIIGITGGIGSGKSTIAQELARQGFAVYDCDREAKRIIAEDPKVREAIIALLGPEAFVHCTSSLCTTYNTAYVAKRVFAEPELLAQLNAIVHPAVAQDIACKAAKAVRPKAVLFIESAILYESGFDRLCDKIIAVDAPEEVRIARTIARDYQGVASEENIGKVRARIHAQGTYETQAAHADLHVSNDGKQSIAEIVSIITHWM